MSAVLLVEDEAAVAEPLSTALEREGYRVRVAASGGDALAALQAAPYDMVLLDLMLPDIDGLQVCRDMRRLDPALPILMLTARSDEIDVVIGLDAGADDYVSKPFRLAELLARMRALRRRTVSPDDLEIGQLRIDLAGRRAWAHETGLDLSAKEFDLLVILAQHVGGVTTRTQLVREVWDALIPETSRTIDTHVSSLRRKLGNPDHPVARLSTVRGVGFRLDPL